MTPADRYKWCDRSGVVDTWKGDAQAMQLVCSYCTQKFRSHAGRLLVEALNKHEQKKGKDGKK